MSALLEIAGLSKRFGGLVALSNVALTVGEGEVRGVIGPNGSGKSTLFNLVTGVYSADPGSLVRFRGEDITNREPHEISRLGLARTFQLLRIFAEMTVIENLLVGCHRQVEYPVGAALFGSARVRAEERRLRAEMLVVEHVMKLVMASCDVVTVLDHGEKIAEGAPDAIRDDHRVIEAYLGKEMKDAEVRAFLRSA